MRLIALLLAGTAPLAAAQERAPLPVEHASAYVFADDPDGCVLIGIQATQLNGISKERLLSVTLFKDESRADCNSNPDLRLIAQGQTKQFDLRVGPKQANAAVTANVPMTIAGSGIVTTFSISVTWQAVGNRVYPRQMMAIDGSASLEHRHGYARPATIQASVIGSGKDLAARFSRSEGFLSAGTTLVAAP